YLKDNLTVPIPGIAFHQRKILPGPDSDFAVNKWNGDKGAQQGGFNMAGAVVVMPGVVVLVKNNPSVFVHIRRDLVQCGFQIMFYNPRLKLQGGQPGNPSGGKAGDDAAFDAKFLTGFLHTL